MCVCVCLSKYVCVCERGSVCVCEQERERKRLTVVTGSEQRCEESCNLVHTLTSAACQVCVCVCVCVCALTLSTSVPSVCV